MNRTRIILYSIAAVVLAGGAVPYATTTTGKPQRARNADVDVAALRVIPRRPDVSLGSAQTWVAHILSRPLFSSTRRPEVSPSLTGDIVVPPRLTGIVAWPGGGFAIFSADKAAAHPVALKVGAVLSGWTVRSIAANGVTMDNGADLLVMRPTFATMGGTAAVSLHPAERGRDPWGRHVRPPTYLERRR